MNTEKFYKIVQKGWKNLDLEINKLTKEEVKITGSIVAKNYFDDGVFLEIIAYKSGTVHVFLTFDSLEENLESFTLINDFNNNTSWAKCYSTEINDKIYLQLHYSYPTDKNEKEAAACVDFALNDLLSDGVIKYLQPLTDLTK